MLSAEKGTSEVPHRQSNAHDMEEKRFGVCRISASMAPLYESNMLFIINPAPLRRCGGYSFSALDMHGERKKLGWVRQYPGVKKSLARQATAQELCHLTAVLRGGNAELVHFRHLASFALKGRDARRLTEHH